ncbi:acyltransferase [Faecalitalea cylindroides]|uniref:acyltransferase n=1 Tax=Faecalitalea cylindroides TaxID=39483 RepID=UPI001D3AEC55|nr:acyltransferase [Faecalitalea cylindroides]MBM6653398.1 acyltransferase [Faecalitalea cylindroides]
MFLRTIVLELLRLYDLPKKIYKIQMFKKNAYFLGGKKNDTIINSKAFCENKTNDKKSIIIGKHCDIGARIIANGSNSKIKIGNNTTIRGDTVIGAEESIEIGDYVIISNRVTIYDNNNHPTSPILRKKMIDSGFYSELWNWNHSAHSPIIIKDNVWIGEKSTILKGVTIGEGAIVASNSVVTKDVDEYTIVAGNPAKFVKYVERG